jgi:hypothetical protein
MYINRYYRDEEMQEALRKWLEIWSTEIKKTLLKFNSLYKTDEL